MTNTPNADNMATPFRLVTLKLASPYMFSRRDGMLTMVVNDLGRGDMSPSTKIVILTAAGRLSAFFSDVGGHSSVQAAGSTESSR